MSPEVDNAAAVLAARPRLGSSAAAQKLLELQRNLVRTAMTRPKVGQPLTSAPELELMLVRHLAPKLQHRTAVDIGAERGMYTAAFVNLGLKTVAIEASPSQALSLRRRFAGSAGVTVLFVAMSSRNGVANLHLGRRPPDFVDDGYEGGAFNSLLDRSIIPDVVSFPAILQIPCRTIAQLVEEGLLPSHPGVLKIDTEGHDLDVLRGAWPNLGDIVIAEYWNRDFIMNGGGVHNDIPDYNRYLDERYIETNRISIVRDEERNQICFQVNPRISLKGSWGNLILFRQTEMMHDALDWCLHVFTEARYRF